MELNEENTSADSRSSSVFDEVITKNSEENVSLSPKSEKYRIKKFYLQKKCDDIQKVSDFYFFKHYIVDLINK